MRLIDADALKEKFQECINSITVSDPFITGVKSGYESAVHFVEQAPTVEERKNGHWKCEDYLLGTTHRCSRCGENYGMPHKIYNFCPNCGAIMDGERE